MKACIDIIINSMFMSESCLCCIKFIHADI